jgi:choline dehydrogenase
MARFKTALAGAFIFSHCSVASSFFETLRAADLIGSHFGVPGFNASFDYVVVGGGTAGLALAYRLAENARYTVAVIEAGGFYELDNGNWSSIPGQVANYLGTNPAQDNPLIDWQQHTVPQPVRGLDAGVS